MNLKLLFFSIILINSTFVLGQDTAKDKKKDIFLYSDDPRKRSKIEIQPIKLDYQFPSGAIVIIDNKIYDASSRIVREMRISDFELMQVIVDSASLSTIKKITIYKSLKK